MKRALRPILLTALVTACLPTAAAQVAGPPVRASHGMVVSGEPFASRAGAGILAQGGNGVDAAVAVGFALAVTLPAAGNIGGGGFMVIHAPGGQEAAVDFRECAPSGATRDMYLGADGRAVPSRSRRGHLAVGVPGTVAGLLHVHGRFGKQSRAQVLAPAIELARKGFPISRHLAASLNGARRRLASFPGSRRIFCRDGRRWKTGDRLVQSDLADTLERISKKGRDGFYKGRTAELLVAEMQRGGGLITSEDLASYAVKERDPVRGTYRGHEIVSMPPPSSGGVALLQMLNVLDAHPIARWGPGSERTLHVMAEAMRWAFRGK